MRVVLEVKDSEWKFLAELLKRFEFVRIQRADQGENANRLDTMPTFNATQLNTSGFTFNREEANER
ncbi:MULTISPECIES: hypothetical protein [unclassified Spirosoma]|uniref:hypothetical protein n=1 Tax=unclassified Spirosoma TaxID=2621999 RepID=UPI0009682967|nr:MULTISPECIES: hypothetical protein [unclassified Spirosoma]MBN8822192.1 hypothetical protein [Spirosoma sp.]OJW72488.1 MAG: hypothetical protein BGO59_15285 [Spirosoma sp. 48-14]